jgi:hypothetical protein
MIQAPFNCGEEIYGLALDTRKSKIWERSTFVTSKLKNSLTFNQNYRCDFHLRCPSGYGKVLYCLLEYSGFHVASCSDFTYICDKLIQLWFYLCT